MNNSFQLICIWFTDSSDSENSDYDIIQEEDVKRLRGKPLPGKTIFMSMERLRWPPAIRFHLSSCVIWPPFTIEQFLTSSLKLYFPKPIMTKGVHEPWCWVLIQQRWGKCCGPYCFCCEKLRSFLHLTCLPSLLYKQKTWLALLHNTTCLCIYTNKVMEYTFMIKY